MNEPEKIQGTDGRLKPTRWLTPQERAQREAYVVKRREDSASISAIASEINCSEGTVHNILKKMRGQIVDLTPESTVEETEHEMNNYIANWTNHRSTKNMIDQAVGHLTGSLATLLLTQGEDEPSMQERIALMQAKTQIAQTQLLLSIAESLRKIEAYDTAPKNVNGIQRVQLVGETDISVTHMNSLGVTVS